MDRHLRQWAGRRWMSRLDRSMRTIDLLEQERVCSDLMSVLLHETLG
jgi:hypothetical protein